MYSYHIDLIADTLRTCVTLSRIVSRVIARVCLAYNLVSRLPVFYV